MAFKKVYISIITLVIFLLSALPVFADNSGDLITLSKAQELARANSRLLKNLNINRDKIGVEYSIALDNYNALNLNSSIKGYQTLIKQTQEQISRLDPDEDTDQIAALEAKIVKYEAVVSGLKSNLPSSSSLNSLELAKRAKQYAYEDMTKSISDAEKSLNYTVESMYFAILDMQKAISLQEKNLEVLSMQLKTERTKVELGLSSQVDEKTVAIQYNNACKGLEDLRTNKQLIVWQLNDLLGRDTTAELYLQDETITPVKMTVNFDEVMNKALENYQKIAQQKRALADFDKDIQDEEEGKEQQVLERSKDLAELELVNLTESVREKVKSLIDSLNSSYRNWEAASLEKEKALRSYQNDKLKYELGIISKLQFMSSEVAYLQAVNNEIKMAQNWVMAKDKLDMGKDGIF